MNNTELAYEPTQEEIAEACLKIQSTWTDEERESRSAEAHRKLEVAGWMPSKKYKPRMAERRCPSCGSKILTNKGMLVHLITSPDCCEYLIETGRSSPGVGEVPRNIGIIPGSVCIDAYSVETSTKSTKRTERRWDVVCSSDQGKRIVLKSGLRAKEEAEDFIRRRIPVSKQVACNRR